MKIRRTARAFILAALAGMCLPSFSGIEPGANAIPPAIGSSEGTVPTAFETIGGVEYFVATFAAPEAYVTYTLQTNANLGLPFADATNSLASAVSTWVGQMITLRAPTSGASKMFFRVKAGDPFVQADATVYATQFVTQEERDAWTLRPSASWTEPAADGSRTMRVEVAPQGATANNMSSMPFDITPYRGCKLLFECTVSAWDVTEPPKSYLGIKYMFHCKSPTLGNIYYNVGNVYGTFADRRLSFSYLIPIDATNATLSLGLQECSGIAEFGDISVTVLEARQPPRPPPMYNPPPAYKGHSLPRLRGVMAPNYFDASHFQVLGEQWNVNLIRWQIGRNWGQANTERDIPEYMQWMNSKLDELDLALAACSQHGLKAVIDIHTPPGGRYENNDMAMFYEIEYQECFTNLWKTIATRYKDNPAVWGYDLVNEPIQSSPSPPGVANLMGTQILAAQAIREIDPETPIFITSGDWSAARGFRYLQPVQISNVIYQIHCYDPHAFTHQGVSDSAPNTVAYPGVINGTMWNKDCIRRELAPVREFQLAYNVHIYVGEFSAVRWAPGAAEYLRDCIELFEEYGWDWSYHAFREWSGWSLEHSDVKGDDQPTSTPTARMQTVLQWFSQNVRAFDP